jgi:6-pyruvoyltetrahydropterin/6-carboxytetrahydropterin synthase
MSRWVVHSRAAFGARHALTSYQGEPEATHSHRWEVAIRVGTEALNEEGYAVDFLAVHNLLQTAVAKLEGVDLNEHPEIGGSSPTAERVAQVLVGWLLHPVHDLGGRLLMVSVWEGPENRVDLSLEE